MVVYSNSGYEILIASQTTEYGRVKMLLRKSARIFVVDNFYGGLYTCVEYMSHLYNERVVGS